jgi:5-deoxy-glucuronate isomerase
MSWFYKAGTLAADGWDVVVDSSIPGWQHTGLRIGTLGEDRGFHIPADDVERIVFALEGRGLTLEYRLAGSSEFVVQDLSGRESVFHGPTDMLYLPMETELRVRGDGRVAIGEAPAKELKPVQFMPADQVPIFIRGAGRETRQVHNFGVPESLDASRFIVCEVIVPSGNWSGIPPHKHDTYSAGKESNLEEIYYFETAVARGFDAGEHSDPTGYLRAYASDERPIDLSEEVRSGDVGLIPYGWHGPAAATPGSDLYFFNVMAGPDPDRSWNITDDPNHAWIRKTWESQATDPRLPYTAK